MGNRTADCTEALSECTGERSALFMGLAPLFADKTGSLVMTAGIAASCQD